MSPVAPLTDTPRSTTTAETELITALAALEAAVGEIEAAPQLNAAVALGDVRRSVADEMAKLNRREPQRPAVATAFAVINRLAAVGALDLPLGDDDRDRLVKWEALGWPGLLASMLLTPSWRWSSAPVFSDVPDWMWGEYANWLFATPNPLITSEDCAIYASHVARHTEELARWAQRNLGSPAVKAALEAYGRHAPSIPLRFANVNTRAAAESRGKLLARLHARAVGPFEPIVLPRAGRALRVGFVARQWDIGPDVCAVLAQLEQLAPERVERILFSATDPVTSFGWHCRDKAQEFHLLPADFAGQVQLLRDSNLDVMVFVGDTDGADDFSRLPSCRVAALQVVENAAHRTSGMAEADLQLVPSNLADMAGNATERIAVLPEGAAAYALRRGGDVELSYSREDLGFPADAFVLVAVLSSMHSCADALNTFVRVLAQAPQTRLVLHVQPETGLPAIGAERFCAVVEAVTRNAGIALDRITILAPEQVSYDESRAIVRLADVFLSTAGSSVWTAEALTSGIPAIAVTNSVEAEWLKAGEMAELVASDADAVVAIATQVANDAERRTALKERLEAAAAASIWSDVLAASDAFTGLIETAFDAIELNGRAKFRRGTTPITSGTDAEFASAMIASESAMANGDVITAVDSAQRALSMRPRDTRVRALYGRALMAEGRAERASTYLMAAVEQRNDDAALWFELATSLRNEGKNSDATKALESVLRLDAKRPDAWLMLIELAEGAGAMDIAQDAYKALKECAPDHPELANLAFRFES